MQSYAREYLGKNQFWTPSSIGLTNSLIDNKLNNLDEVDTSGLLSKKEAEDTYTTKTNFNEKINEINNNLSSNYYTGENINTLHNQMMDVIDNFFLSKKTAEETYLKKTDAIVPKFHSFSLYSTDGTDEKHIITNTGTSLGSIQIDIPSTIGKGIKLIYINFSVRCLKKSPLDALAFGLNKEYNWYPRNNKKVTVKGVCTFVGDDGRSVSIYDYSIHDVFTGKISTLYLHPFFDNDKSYSDEIYFYTTSSQPQVNVRIIELN